VRCLVKAQGRLLPKSCFTRFWNQIFVTKVGTQYIYSL